MRRRWIVAIVGVGVIAALAVGAIVVLRDEADTGDESANFGTATTIEQSDTSPSAVDEPAVPPVVVPADAHPWRAGYAGVGPIELGMSVDDAAQAANASSRETDGGCLVALDPLPGSELPPNAISLSPGTVDVVLIRDPRIYTISGVHVGSTEADVRRTYSPVGSREVVAGSSALTITNDAGRTIYFLMQDDIVRAIDIAESEELYEGNARC